MVLVLRQMRFTLVSLSESRATESEGEKKNKKKL